MNAETIVNKLKNHPKASHVKVCWRRAAKVKKDCAALIEKETCAWVRAGISYQNLSTVKDGIAEGTRGEVQSLPWGQWRDGFANYIIDHTPKGATENKEYIRMYPATFENLQKGIFVEWFMDGRPVSYETVEPFLLASEKPKPEEEKAECFTVSAESIQWVD